MKTKYPKIMHFGDEITGFFKDGICHIEEKVDGSQFRIWVDDNKIEMGSKDVDWSDERPADKMFNKAVEEATNIFKNSGLKDTMIFCEYVSKPHHNTLNYGRVPNHNIIIFDVRQGDRFLSYEEKLGFASAFDLEVVPKLWEGDGKTLTIDIINGLLERESILGKEKIEGLVFKNYSKIFSEGYQAGKMMMLKYVREEFKERNKVTWKGNTKTGMIELIIEELKTEARWNKAVQHLREKGIATNSPKDIGNLLKEISDDIEKEDSDEIKEKLWKFYSKEIRKGVCHGFPEWYKKKLLEEALNENNN